MKNIKKYFFIIVIITFFVMLYTFKTQYKDIVLAFQNVDYFWFFIAVFLIGCFHLIDAYFIIYYCRQIKPDYKIWEGIEVQQVGTFLNSITPAAAGGQFGQLALLAKQKISTKQSASMLMVSFISWQTILVLFSLLALSFNYSHLAEHYSHFFSLVFVGFGIDLTVITFLFFGAFSKKFHTFIFNHIIPFLGRFKLLKNVEKKKEHVKEWLLSFRTEFKYMLSHRDIMYRRLLTDFTKLTIFYSITFFCAKSLNAPITINDYFILLVLSSFSKMITSLFPTPGNSGGTEGVFILLFSPILGSTTASVMILWRVVTYFLPMLVSFLVFANINEMKLVKNKA